ncbi:molybdate ABC transporter permease subunit [Virgibacillus sp. M23]|uniref:molybdate ABC transporter permease subunit n=1 Tax=Virgibacillus sp. M23 TaxID=3079030 RepID=UPI002A9197CA|nr:molybdate ABC transporter permease subunit [Virgibacillus sp. M23]MDY7043000.1 molybdate ABC transporter permease subunit [Virgibacillus sp. M23]
MDLLQNEVVMQKFLSPIWLSIKVTAISGVVVILIGTIVGRFLARKTFKGKALLETIIMLPMVLPSTVVGFLLIILFGKNSIVGQATEWLFKQPLIFTWWAAVIASAVVAFPLVYQSAKTGFQGIDLSIEEAARVDGANEWKIFFLISIPLAFRSLVLGSILSFARALGEFGATLMFAGNIPGVTQTIPMAIYIALDSGNIELAWLWVISIVIISFFMLLMVRIKQE